MIEKKEIQEFLDSLPDDSKVAIGDDGLSLVEVDRNGEETDNFLEIGLTPHEEMLINDEEDEDED